jgi:hypothetical protein
MYGSFEGVFRDGIYRLEGNRLIVTFNHGSYWSDEAMRINDSRDIINWGESIFVAERSGGIMAFLSNNWLIILIGFIVLSAIYNTVEKMKGKA